jgi:hypothetical protein
VLKLKGRGLASTYVTPAGIRCGTKRKRLNNVPKRIPAGVTIGSGEPAIALGPVIVDILQQRNGARKCYKYIFFECKILEIAPYKLYEIQIGGRSARTMSRYSKYKQNSTEIIFSYMVDVDVLWVYSPEFEPNSSNVNTWNHARSTLENHSLNGCIILCNEQRCCLMRKTPAAKFIKEPDMKQQIP